MEKQPKLQELAKKYPQLIGDLAWLECDTGWDDIVGTTCSLIHWRCEQKAHNNKKFKWPQIVQIKEKFGSLRIYIYNADGDDYINGVIAFAEMWSSKVCEHCGARGRQRNDGWIKVRCDSCEAEHQQAVEARRRS